MDALVVGMLSWLGHACSGQWRHGGMAVIIVGVCQWGWLVAWPGSMNMRKLSTHSCVLEESSSRAA